MEAKQTTVQLLFSKLSVAKSILIAYLKMIAVVIEYSSFHIQLKGNYYLYNHTDMYDNGKHKPKINIILIYPLLPEILFSSFSGNSLRYALFVYRLIVATIIENFLMIPSELEINILAKRSIYGTLGIKGGKNRNAESRCTI